MVIVCEGCEARFRMNYALFQDANGARIRCRKCGGYIEVRHPEASPVSPAPEIPFPHAPGAAPAGEPETATVHSGHLGTLDSLREEPLSPPTVTDAAQEQDSSREKPAAEITSLKRRLRSSSHRGPSMRTIFLLVVPGILLLAGGAFFFRNTNPSQEPLRKFFPPSGSGNAARAASTASAVEKPAYEVRDMKSSHEKTFIGGNLFVIEGTVANVGKSPSRGIRVQATLLDKDNQALVNNTVFAANLIDNTTLRHANRTVIEGFLGLRHGERNANLDIPMGKSLPFMVVFFDPPGRVEYFTVKALDAE